jgi:hypothetical protein
MLNKLADLLTENEKLSFQLSNLGSGIYKLIMSFQPMPIGDYKPSNEVKAEVDSLIASANLIRAELAKPKVFKGTPDDICDELDALLELVKSPSYCKAQNTLSSMIQSIESTIAEASKKAEEAKTKAKAKSQSKTTTPKESTASTCQSGSCGDVDEDQVDLFSGL